MRLYIFFFLFNFCFSFHSFASELISNQLKKAKNSVWQIKSSKYQATGFFFDSNLLAVNAHTILGFVDINLHDEQSYQDAIKRFYLSQDHDSRIIKIKSIRALSLIHDLAIIETKEKVSDYLPLTKNIPEQKNSVFMLGYPKAIFHNLQNTSSIKMKNESTFSTHFNHSSFGGASGSPLINAQGEVVGIGKRSYINEFLATRSEHLKEMIESLDNQSDASAKKIIHDQFEETKRMAKKNHVPALRAMGIIYNEGGQGIQKDQLKAYDFFEKAARRGDVISIGRISDMLSPPDFNKKYNDWIQRSQNREIVKWLKKGSKQNDAQAQMKLGLMYYHGRGVFKNIRRSTTLFKQAAEQGNALAKYYLGKIYIELGEPLQALEFFDGAAAGNEMESQYTLGFFYSKGMVVDQNDGKAYELFEKAAKQGHAGAQFELGKAFLYGNKKVRKNPIKSLEWLKKAAEQEHTTSQYLLGIILSLDELEHGMLQDYDLAVSWLQLAALKNHVGAQFQLGVIYSSGLKKDLQNDTEAVKWFRKAAEQGHPKAQHALAQMHYHERGAARNLQVILKWLRKAAEQGDRQAQYDLGNMYYDGKEMSRNPKKALKWFRKAAEQEHNEAQKIIESIQAKNNKCRTIFSVSK